MLTQSIFVQPGDLAALSLTGCEPVLPAVSLPIILVNRDANENTYSVPVNFYDDDPSSK
jgi:hypothetical protein